jgi:hypothetical protein
MLAKFDPGHVIFANLPTPTWVTLALDVAVAYAGNCTKLESLTAETC